MARFNEHKPNLVFAQILIGISFVATFLISFPAFLTRIFMGMDSKSPDAAGIETLFNFLYSRSR